jgi:ribosomal protein S30
MTKHGGLTRAGKVKNATPFQGKTVKNKIDSGRAKKRRTFNVRYNNGSSEDTSGS